LRVEYVYVFLDSSRFLKIMCRLTEFTVDATRLRNSGST
jgi:hypothetical protein